jgi:sulfate permease, SulP family
MPGDMLGETVQSQRTLDQLWELLKGLPQTNLPTLALSALVAGGILFGNRLAPRLPFALFAVIVTIAASAAFHFGDRGIAVIGRSPEGCLRSGYPK